MAGDLTQKLARFLDRHLVFPLLEFLTHKDLYDVDDMQRAKLSLVSATNMVDYAMDIHKELYAEEPPQEMKDRRIEVIHVACLSCSCLACSSWLLKCRAAVHLPEGISCK